MRFSKKKTHKYSAPKTMRATAKTTHKASACACTAEDDNPYN